MARTNIHAVDQGGLGRMPSVWEEELNLSPTELQRLYLDDVWRYVSSRLNRTEDAEDVTMEVMSAAFKRMQSGVAVEDYRSWLLTIAKNKVTDSLRRRYRRKESPLTLADGESAKIEMERFAVNAILDKMTEEHSQALVLKYVNGLTTDEVALVLKKSPDATNSLLQRARQNFRELGAGTFDFTDREEDDL